MRGEKNYLKCGKRLRQGALGLACAIATSVAFANPALAQDPGIPSGASVTTVVYDYGDEAFTPPGESPVELRAEVYYPTALDEGPYPVVLLLHGDHDTCYRTDGLSTYKGWPCNFTFDETDDPELRDPEIPNYLGYRSLGETLASWGFIVASVSANGVNGSSSLNNGMPARAELLQRHLEQWETFNTVGAAPFGTQFVGRVDLTRVGTMGHSRGGEAVTWHHNLNLALESPYGLRAVFSLAPTKFPEILSPAGGDQLMQQVHGAEHAVLLPYCDGDQNELRGIEYFDINRYSDLADPASKFAFVVMGANHNFFNSIWTPGGFITGTSDDGFWDEEDPACGDAARLTPEEQLDVGNAYMVGFFRAYVKGETTFIPQLRGDVAAPPSIAAFEAHNSYHPSAADRLDINRLTESSELGVNTLGGSVTATGLVDDELCGAVMSCFATAIACTIHADCPSGLCNSETGFCERYSGRTPHSTLFFASTELDFTNLHLEWDGSSIYRNQIPSAHQDFTRFDTLHFRAAVDPADPRNTSGEPQEFLVVLTDANGHESSVSTADHGDNLYYPPGTPLSGTQAVLLNSIRIGFDAFADGQLDFSRITRIDFRFPLGSTGGIFVADLAVSTSCITSTYEAEDMSRSTGSAVSNGWGLYSNGSVWTNHHFSGTEASVTVTARGTPVGGVWPRMSVRVAGVEVGNVFVNSSGWQAYTFDLPTPPSSPQEIRVSFTNDAYAPPADRNLFIDKLIVDCGGSFPEPPGCSIATAQDMGAPGNNVSVVNNGCLKVQSGYPTWWGVRTMKLETASPGTYPVPFTWSNTCSGSGGSGLFTGDWQAQFLSVASSSCATLIDLTGSGTGNVSLRYWAN